MKSLAQRYLQLLQQDIGANRIVLPMLPEVALRVRHMADDPDCQLPLLASQIEADAAIAARLLRVANSSALRRATEVSSVYQAVSSLGVNQVKYLVLQLAILQGLRQYPDRQHLVDFMSIAFQLSAYCRALALSQPHLDAELASMMGLLHDLGKLPLRGFLAARSELTDPLRLQLELVMHPLVGAMMLQNWQLPTPIVEATRAHERVLREGSSRADYADLLISANVLYFGLESGRYQRYQHQRIPALEKCLGGRGFSDVKQSLQLLEDEAKALAASLI